MNIKSRLTSTDRRVENVDLRETITEVLGDFGINATIDDVVKGKVITRYTIVPERGTRVREFAKLHTEISMETGGLPVSIQAPIYGTNTVGIDIPNVNRGIISMKNVLDAVDESDAVLPLALGEKIDGTIAVEDLTKAPHLLIAGQTGSGKSVGINSIITGLVHKHDPDTLNFVMVDPKFVELSVYNDLPHMAYPVVTDAAEAVEVLGTVVDEMEYRYKLLAEHRVRNIKSYIEKTGDVLPYLVVVIDELADLMMTAAKDIETHIVRIAQKARAVGIHLIVATQRPSVDVITGLMKANIPARVSFKVASGTDSRIILDENGAEDLLGQGDMLVHMNSNTYRAHGGWISDDETVDIVDYLRKNIQFSSAGISVGKEKYLANMPDADLKELYEDDPILYLYYAGKL